MNNNNNSNLIDGNNILNFDKENHLIDTNQNIIFSNNFVKNENKNNDSLSINANMINFINDSMYMKKNSITQIDNSVNSNNSDNSTNPNNLSTLNNLISNNKTNNNKNNIKNLNTKSSSLIITKNNPIGDSEYKKFKTANSLKTSNFPDSIITNDLDKNIVVSNSNAYGITNINSTDLNYGTGQTSMEKQNIFPMQQGNPFCSQKNNSLRNSYSSINTLTTLKNKPKNVYIPKCICLVSVHPFCNQLLNILEAIYSYTSSNTKLKRPLEKIIENLVIEIPLPPRGLYSVNYELFDITFNFKQTQMNELPYIDFNLEKIFMHFEIDQTLEIFKHLLLETRMIFFSKDMKILSPIIHGFVTLIYPFKYPFNYITVIPQENFTILENVTPFIIGINQDYTPNFFEIYEIDISEINFLVIDIDNKKIDLHCYIAKNKDETTKKKIFKKEFPNLPEHYKNKLHDKIREYFDNIKSGRRSHYEVHNMKANISNTNSNTLNSNTTTSNNLQKNNKNKESNSNFVKTIRNYFYQFMVSIFLNYSKYLNLDYYNNKFMAISIPSVRNLFKVDEFLSSVNTTDRPFYSKFILETQQFADFIYKRMIPKDSKEKLEILLFDEHISEKNNRKYFSKKTPKHFINSELYQFKSTYYVEKQRQMSDFEKKYFFDYENRKSALKYGQEILFEKDGDITISYFYFPTLMTNFYFYNNIKNYIIPRNLSEELEQINIEMVSKSHLSNS